MAESTQIHGPSANAPTVSEKVAHCQVCHIQWQVQGDADGKPACSFCGAPSNAVAIISEHPDYGGAILR